jgi:hypothetical protein
MRRANSGSFKPGHPGGPGRAKGSRNRLGEEFLQDLYADWIGHGAAVIAKVRETDPSTYLKVTASLLPKELDIRDSRPLERLTDDDLLRIIQSDLEAERERRKVTGEWPPEEPLPN